MNPAVVQNYSGAPLGAPVYELTHVSKTYASNKVVALEDVSLTLRKGSFTSVIGSRLPAAARVGLADIRTPGPVALAATSG